tara:strand:- start:50 stop:757 length:708 start_codon:yes stop_codon:yes gene_type:complete
LLTPQGKFIADFFIIDHENSYLIETHKKFAEDLINKLKIYKLRAKVEINIVNDLLSLSIIENNDLLQSEADILLFKDPRNDKLGNKIFVAKNKFKEIEKKYNLIEDNFEKYRELLIKNLIPFSSEDLIQDKSLLLENNFDKINAIDWEKGCYVGQEITARMKYRALLKKQLYALELISGNINIGDKIVEKEVNLGQVISKANQYIFCMLKIELVKEKSEKKSLLEINSFATLKFL